jgi:hypothetical protein
LQDSTEGESQVKRKLQDFETGARVVLPSAKLVDFAWARAGTVLRETVNGREMLGVVWDGDPRAVGYPADWPFAAAPLNPPHSIDECRDASGQLDLGRVLEWETWLKEQAVKHAGELQVIRQNVLAILVCARVDLTRERIVELTEMLCPCGTRNGWQIAEDPPAACDKMPDRLHWKLGA